MLLHRALAEGHPDAYLVEFARSLNTHGVTLASLDRFDEALPVIIEAVDIRRSLAERNPTAFMLDFATSISNQSGIHNGLRQHDQALTSIAEAVLAYRHLLHDRTLNVNHKLGFALRKQAKQH
ncbi:hypothetical protein [Edaphobacter aggregans]|uniref:hypothetical protein n=1 Tax=Edaphobacter aggregans TaxID=570835 RepID=UPI001470508D|nr:hypothetical protein [Edaphobacter aggregans]